jgi:hypothetical protein
MQGDLEPPLLEPPKARPTPVVEVKPTVSREE